MDLKTYIKELRKIRNKKDKISKRLKEINEQETNVEGMILAQMRQEGLDKVTIKRYGTASIKHDIYPAIKNWDECLKFMVERREFVLLTKKINAAVWREMIEEGIKVPGIDSFEKDTLLFRRK